MRPNEFMDSKFISLLVKRTLLQALHAAGLPESEGFKFSWRHLQQFRQPFSEISLQCVATLPT